MPKKKNPVPKTITLEEHSQYIAALRTQLMIARPQKVLTEKRLEAHAHIVCQMMLTHGAGNKIPPAQMQVIMRRVLGLWQEIVPDNMKAISNDPS